MQVRDALGLTYDVSFELSLYDRLRTGWFVCHVTSTHAKIDEALEASLRVLRSLLLQRVTPRELLRAKRTVLTRHESEMKVPLCPVVASCTCLTALKHCLNSSQPSHPGSCSYRRCSLWRRKSCCAPSAPISRALRIC